MWLSHSTESQWWQMTITMHKRSWDCLNTYFSNVFAFYNNKGIFLLCVFAHSFSTYRDPLALRYQLWPGHTDRLTRIQPPVMAPEETQRGSSWLEDLVAFLITCPSCEHLSCPFYLHTHTQTFAAYFEAFWVASSGQMIQCVLMFSSFQALSFFPILVIYFFL